MLSIFVIELIILSIIIFITKVVIKRIAISETAPVLDIKEIFFWKQKDNKKNIYNYIILYICSYVPNIKNDMNIRYTILCI